MKTYWDRWGGDEKCCLKTGHQRQIIEYCLESALLIDGLFKWTVFKMYSRVENYLQK